MARVALRSRRKFKPGIGKQKDGDGGGKDGQRDSKSIEMVGRAHDEDRVEESMLCQARERIDLSS